MMFRTSYRMSDSLSRATGKVYRRAWRQAFYGALVFLGAWVGHFQGLTAVAFGVLGALFINYLLMAQLSLSVAGVSWLQFGQAQLPALLLALMSSAAALGATAGIRHLGLPPFAGLVAGSVAAVGTGVLTARLAPRVVLGQHGIRMRDTLLPYLLDRLRSRPKGLRASR
jgi:PST family polysaccharide transporter